MHYFLSWNYETDGHLKFESGEDIGILSLVFNKIKPYAEISIRSFSVLISSNDKHFLEIKGNFTA